MGLFLYNHTRRKLPYEAVYMEDGWYETDTEAPTTVPLQDHGEVAMAHLLDDVPQGPQVEVCQPYRMHDLLEWDDSAEFEATEVMTISQRNALFAEVTWGRR